jgi:hypothetical protein
VSTDRTSKQMSPQLAGLVNRLQEWSRNCLIDGLKMDKGEPSLQDLLREAYLTLMRQSVPETPDDWIATAARMPTPSDARGIVSDCVLCWFPKMTAGVIDSIGPGFALVSWYNVAGWGTAISHWRRMPDKPLHPKTSRDVPHRAPTIDKPPQ